MSPRCSLLASCLLLAGCASTVETVDHRLLLQPGTETYTLDDYELFVMPVELAAPLPSFPAGVAEGAETVFVCAETWLSADGDVTRVSPLHGVPGCPATEDPAAVPFEEAVVGSLGDWRFSPAMICRFRPDQREQRERGDCRGDVDVRRVPVRLAFSFEFRRGEGRALAARRLPD